MKAGYWQAVRRGDAVAVAGFLRQDPSLVKAADESGKTALHWAAETDQAELARRLLDAGADIEARTAWGASPLDWAATMGSAAVADLLLARGATGLTLINAAALGRSDRVESIIDSGEDLVRHRRRAAPEVATGEWPADTAHLLGDVLSDALYAAARNGHTEVVRYLLSCGADVNAKGYFGATALHWAAINGWMETAECLISSGADPTVRDARFGACADGWAEEGGHAQLADYLRSRR